MAEPIDPQVADALRKIPVVKARKHRLAKSAQMPVKTTTGSHGRHGHKSKGGAKVGKLDATRQRGNPYKNAQRAAPVMAGMIPPPAPPTRAAKAAIGVTGRYIICPVSAILHETRFVPIKDTNGKFWCCCPCGCEVSLPGTWTKDSGYSHTEASNHALRIGGIVCGY